MKSDTTLTHLQQPEKLDDVLTQQRDHYDCLPCRLMGSAAFTGLGAYTWYSGRKQLQERELEILRSGSRFGLQARRASVLGMSAMLVAVGAYRLVN